MPRGVTAVGATEDVPDRRTDRGESASCRATATRRERITDHGWERLRHHRDDLAMYCGAGIILASLLGRRVLII